MSTIKPEFRLRNRTPRPQIVFANEAKQSRHLQKFLEQDQQRRNYPAYKYSFNLHHLNILHSVVSGIDYAAGSEMEVTGKHVLLLSVNSPRDWIAMCQMLRFFILLSLFFMLANQARSAAVFVTFYIPKPGERENIESQLNAFRNQKKIEDYTFDDGEQQLFVLMNTHYGNEIFPLLKIAGAVLTERVSNKAEKEYQKKEAAINREKRLSGYVAFEITLASDADVTKFIAAIKQTNLLDQCYPLCQDATLSTLFYALLPRGFGKEMKEPEIHCQREFADPGRKSIDAIFEILSQQKIKRALLEFEVLIAPLDISQDLITVLGFFDQSLTMFGSELDLFFPRLIEKIIPKFFLLSAIDKKKILFSALEDIQRTHRPIRTAELYLTVLQSLLLHPRISDLQEKKFLSTEQDSVTTPRVFTDNALIRFLSNSLIKFGGPPFVFEGIDHQIVLEDHPWSYFVFNTPGGYHRSAILTCAQKDRLDVLLLDPQNIQTALLKKDPSLEPTFRHIRAALDEIFPHKKKQFLSFNFRRQQDYFNCGIFVVTDYETICTSLAEFEKLMAKINQSAPIYDSVVPLEEIPLGLLISAQSLDVAEPLLEVLRSEGAVRPIYPEKSFVSQKKGSAYILMKHIIFLQNLLDSEVIFTEGDE